jgi:hypothetical protein
MSNRQHGLVVDGEPSDELSPWFPGMTLSRKVGRVGQAKHRGPRQRISKLGVTQLSTMTTDEDEFADGGSFGHERIGASAGAAEGMPS